MTDEHAPTSGKRRCSCGWNSPYARQPVVQAVMNAEWRRHLREVGIEVESHRSAVRLLIRREEKLP